MTVEESPGPGPMHVDRRTFVRGLAWGAPITVLATVVPLAAASGPIVVDWMSLMTMEDTSIAFTVTNNGAPMVGGTLTIDLTATDVLEFDPEGEGFQSVSRVSLALDTDGQAYALVIPKAAGVVSGVLMVGTHARTFAVEVSDET